MSADAAGTSSYARADLLPGVLGSTVGYASTASEESLHRGVPSPWLTFILSLDGPVVWSEDEGRLGTAQERRETVVLSPLHTRAAFVRMPRRQAGIQLAVHPLAARRLLGVRTSELDQGRVTGLDVLGPQVEALRQRLVETRSWPGRFAVLGAYLRDRVEHAPASASVRPELEEAWRWLRRTGGRQRLDGLARHVALSPRHLGSLFSAEVGLSPKRVARLVRFDATMGRLTGSVRAGQPVTLAALAAEAGYADQSHLDREFRAHLATTPTGWLAEERRNVQAGGHRNGEA